MQISEERIQQILGGDTSERALAYAEQLRRYGENGAAAAAAAPVAGDFFGGLIGGVKGLVTGGIPGAISGAISGSKGGPPAPQMPPGALVPGGMMPGGFGGVVGGIIGGIGSGVGSGIINRLTGGSNGSSSGCNCGSSGRDSCTRQKLSSQPAPLATFFGGCCPPGRTLRRINNGRDICIKTPKMNVFNPSALRRADQRITGFARRAAPILKDMGYTVGKTRSVKLKVGKGRRRR